MSDRPSATNGKRNRSWGTRDACPACGQCLCFACHPAGPCLDDPDAAAVWAAAGATASARRRGGAGIDYPVTWLAASGDGPAGMPALRPAASFGAAGDPLR